MAIVAPPHGYSGCFAEPQGGLPPFGNPTSSNAKACEAKCVGRVRARRRAVRRPAPAVTFGGVPLTTRRARWLVAFYAGRAGCRAGTTLAHVTAAVSPVGTKTNSLVHEWRRQVGVQLSVTMNDRSILPPVLSPPDRSQCCSWRRLGCLLNSRCMHIQNGAMLQVLDWLAARVFERHKIVVGPGGPR